MDNSESTWIAEGRFIHRRLFGFDASPDILGRYAGFLSTIASTAAWPQMAQAIDRELDVEAVEFAFRFRKRHHPLQQRIHGLCFICEADPAYWKFFYAGKRAQVLAWGQLAFTGLRSLWLLAKGNYLIHRHHLV